MKELYLLLTNIGIKAIEQVMVSNRVVKSVETHMVDNIERRIGRKFTNNEKNMSKEITKNILGTIKFIVGLEEEYLLKNIANIRVR